MRTYNLSSNNSLATNSSGGQLLKWKVENKYIKTSTLDKQALGTQFMYESFAEVIASRIGSRLGLDIIKYKLCEVIIDNSIKTIACESLDFKPQGYKEYSFGKLMQLGKIKSLGYNRLSDYEDLIRSTYELTRLNVRKYIDTVILFDSLILNDDRHYGNFGLMQDTSSGHIRTLPLFDNGNSLFCHKHTNELVYGEDLIQYLRFKPFSINCNEQTTLVKNNALGNIQILIKYIPGLMYEIVQQGLPKDKAKFIQDLLNSRIKYIESVYK